MDKTDRRAFLAGMVTAAGLGLAGLLAREKISDELFKRNPPEFNQVYAQTVEFVDRYNKFSTGKGSWNSFSRADHELTDSLHDYKIDLRDNNEVSNFYAREGKVFLRHSIMDGDKPIDEFIAGSIKDSLKEKFTHNNTTFEYSVVLFEQDAKTIFNEMGEDSAVAFWDNDTKTAFVNLTQLGKDAKEVYEDHKLPLRNELYEKIMQKARINPLFAENPFMAFSDEFINVGIESAKVQQPMHFFYPAGGREEFMPSIADILANPEMSSYPLVIAEEHHPLIYQFLGCSREQLVSMPAEKRAELARAKLDKKD